MTKLSRPDDDGDLPAKVRHPFHKGHSLKLIPDDDGVKFKCDGCKLLGSGARYECGRGAACNLDLHTSCALAPAVRELGGHEFVLQHRPPAAAGRRLCDACGGSARGFVYHCYELDHDVHPCCADLPEVFDLAGISFELSMMDEAPRRRCALCAENTKGARRGRVNRPCWSYRSVGFGGEAVFLHVACASDLAYESFTNVSLGKPMAMAAHTSQTESLVVKASGDATRVYRSDEEMVTVRASALRALLLKGRDRGKSGGALERNLRVLCFIVRAVIGIIFGNPTAMIVMFGQAVFSGG